MEDRTLRRQLHLSLDAFKQVFRHPDLRYLELALGTNWTAENAYLVALSVYAYGHGGATAVGLVGLIRMVPAGVAGLFGAVVADRYRREWLLRLLYLGRAILAAATGIAFFGGAPVAVVFALAALLNILAVLLRPGYWALLPDLATTPEELVACNVVASVFEGLAWLAGPLAAGVLIKLANPGVVFFVAAGALLGSALLSTLVKAAHLVQAKATEARSLADTLAGVKTVAQNRDARLIFGLFGSQTMVRGALNVFVVVAAIRLLSLGDAGVGWLSSAFGVGGLIGAVATFALVGRRRLALPFGVGLILWGAPIALVGIWPHAILALVLLGVPGVGNAVLDVAGLTMLQRTIPNKVLGRVFGALEAQVFATVGLGSVVASGLVAWLGTRGAMIAIGSTLPALALLSWRRLREIDDATAVPESELALLRGIPMFASLPAVALEHLATNLTPITVASRSAVFRRGDVGDRLYVIVDGQARVSRGGTTTNRLGPGDCFGEIALMRGVPRTATVTASGDLKLVALESELFLAAVSGNRLSTDEVERVVDQYCDAIERPIPLAKPAPTKRRATKRAVAARKRAVVAAKKPPGSRSRGAGSKVKRVARAAAYSRSGRSASSRSGGGTRSGRSRRRTPA